MALFNRIKYILLIALLLISPFLRNNFAKAAGLQFLSDQEVMYYVPSDVTVAGEGWFGDGTLGCGINTSVNIGPLHNLKSDGKTVDYNSNDPTGVDRADHIASVLASMDFVGAGGKLNAVQLAALMGNFKTETGGSFDPRVDNGIGFVGLAQWGKGTRYWANGPGTTNIDDQIAWVKTELDGGYRDATSDFWESNSPDDLLKATFSIVRNFEIAIANASLTPAKWNPSLTNDKLASDFAANGSALQWGAQYTNAQAMYDRYKGLTTGEGCTGGNIDATSSATARESAKRFVELADAGKFNFVLKAPEDLANLRKYASDGTPGPDLCSKGIEAIDSRILDTLSSMASVHTMRFTSMLVGRTSGQHCAGKAIDLDTIDGMLISNANGDNQTHGPTYADPASAKKIAQFVGDFVNTMHKLDPNVTVGIGQYGCDNYSAEIDALNLPKISVFPDGCHHIHLAIQP